LLCYLADTLDADGRCDSTESQLQGKSSASSLYFPALTGKEFSLRLKCKVYSSSASIRGGSYLAWLQSLIAKSYLPWLSDECLSEQATDSATEHYYTGTSVLLSRAHAASASAAAAVSARLTQRLINHDSMSIKL